MTCPGGLFTNGVFFGNTGSVKFESVKTLMNFLPRKKGRQQFPKRKVFSKVSAFGTWVHIDIENTRSTRSLRYQRKRTIDMGSASGQSMTGCSSLITGQVMANYCVCRMHERSGRFLPVPCCFVDAAVLSPSLSTSPPCEGISHWVETSNLRKGLRWLSKSILGDS